MQTACFTMYKVCLDNPFLFLQASLSFSWSKHCPTSYNVTLTDSKWLNFTYTGWKHQIMVCETVDFYMWLFQRSAGNKISEKCCQVRKLLLKPLLSRWLSNCWNGSLLFPSGEPWNGDVRRLVRHGTAPVIVKWEGAHLLSLDPWCSLHTSYLSSCENIHYFTNFHFTLKPVQVVLSHTTAVFGRSVLRTVQINTKHSSLTLWECKITSTGSWMLTSRKIPLREFIVLWQQQKPAPTQLSVTRITFLRVQALITFLLLCNGASKSLPADCCFRCLPLPVSHLWSKCSPLCLLHLVAFVLKISVLWQLPKAVTFCIPFTMEYKRGTIPYLNGTSCCPPHVQFCKRERF